MPRAYAGFLILLCFGCADPEPAEAPSARPPPDPFAADLVENLLKPAAVQPSREEVEAACADPARACELYKALREGRAVIQVDPPARAPRAPPGR